MTGVGSMGADMAVVLRCRHCKTERRVDEAMMLQMLQNRGMLRRETKPDAELLRELLSTIVSDAPCQDCGSLGATVEDDWDDDWSDEVYCKACKAIIPAERLEVFPDTEYCPTCKGKHESGESPGEEADYCPRCGGVMSLAKRTGAGLAGYQMVCGDCGMRGG